MNTHSLDITLRAPFGNLEREQHVLILCYDQTGKFWLGSKPKFYPEGIYRLVGGGVDQGETSLEAAIRETQEELGLTVTSTDLQPLSEIILHATTGEEEYHFTTTVYALRIDPAKVKPGDDIESLVPLNDDEYQQLIQLYLNLDESLEFAQGEYRHFWQDYGKVYGPIHELARQDWQELRSAI